MKRIISFTLVALLLLSVPVVVTHANAKRDGKFVVEQVFGVMDEDYVGSFNLLGPNTVEYDYESALYYPMCGMKVTSDGNVLVADTAYGRIHVFDGMLDHEKVFGSLGFGDGKLQYPVDINTDSHGNIYIADFYNSYVAKFDSDGEFLGRFGAHGDENGEFIGPGGVAVDDNGNVYVSDGHTARVQKFDSNFNYLLSFNTDINNRAPLNAPGPIRIGPNGNIYVAEMSSGQVYKFSDDGKYLGAALKLEKGEGVGKLGSFEIDSNGKLYMLNRAPSGNIILIADKSGSIQSKIRGFIGVDDMADGLALASDGTIYVHVYGQTSGDDYFPDRPFICGNVQKLLHIDESGSVIGKELEFNPSDSERGGSIADCAVSLSGNVYGISVIFRSDGTPASRVLIWDKDGDHIDTIDPDDFELPANTILSAITIDSYDNIFVAANTAGGAAIAKLNNQTEEVTIVGSGILEGPTSLCVDAMDNIYVADNTKKSILVFTSQGRLRNEFRLNIRPNSVHVDPFRNIVVTSDSQIVIINKKGREIDNFGGQGRAPGNIYFPYGVLFSDSGAVIVSDCENGRIQVFERGEGSDYEFSYTSERQFYIPFGMCWGPDNKVYLSDYFHGVIYRIGIEGEIPPGTGNVGGEPPIPPQPPEPETILSDGEIIFNPNDVKVQVGSNTNIDVDIKYASNIYGVGFTLKYDPKLLKLEDCKPGDFLSSDGNENLFFYKESVPGTVVIGGPTRTSNVGGMNGQGNLIKLKMSGIKEGDTTLELTDVLVKDPDLNNIQVITKSCRVKISAQDSKPPEINATIPSCSWEKSYTINGSVERGATVEIEVSGKKTKIPTKPDGSFSYKMDLKTGDNAFALIATDDAGNSKRYDHVIKLQTKNVIIMWLNKANYIHNSKPSNFEVPPQLIGSSTYVPLRALGDMLNCNTEWVAAERKVIYTYTDPCSSDKVVLEIWIGKTDARKNGAPFTINPAPQIVNSRTLVPLRAISEGLGAKVDWDGATKQITITHPQ